VPSPAPAQRKSGKPLEGKKEDSQHDQASNCVPCQVEAKFNHPGTIDPDAECCQASRDENSNGATSLPGASCVVVCSREVSGRIALSSERVERRLTAILAADVAGYSRLMGADEEGTLAQLKAHRRALFDPKIAEHRGRIVKTTGDGMLVEFASVVDAFRCAVEVQRGMAERNAEVSQDQRIEFRMGVHQGDIVVEDQDIFGDGVNVAARLEGLAEPGGICVSARVHEDVQGKLEVPFENAGEQQLKNIVRPVRVYRVQLSGATQGQRPALPLPDKPSIAVLPFQNLSGDPDQEYFADGVVEEIISALSRIRSLFVIARNSTFTYKGRTIDLKRVSRELGVRYVLEGSVRRSGERVRITAQLINGQDGTHIWSDRYDGRMADIFDLQDQITERIVGALEPTIRSVEVERARRKRPDNLDAYDCVMRALSSIWVVEREANAEALVLLERAMALDPGYASAKALAAWCHAQRLPYLWTTAPAIERALALELATEAARLDSNDPLVLTVLSAAYAASSQFQEAAPLIEKALALDPNSAWAWQRSGVLRTCLGEPDVGIEHLQRAMRISPLDPYNFNALIGIGVAHFWAGRYELAAQWVTQGIAEKPSATWAWRIAAAAYSHLDRMDAARTALERFMRGNPGVTLTSVAEGSTPSAASPSFKKALIDGLRKAGLPE
jgi:adenylate cyclase